MLPSNDMGYVESHADQIGYNGEQQNVFVEEADVGYAESSTDGTMLESSGVELGYEQPVEQEEQVSCSNPNFHVSNFLLKDCSCLLLIEQIYLKANTVQKYD